VFGAALVLLGLWIARSFLTPLAWAVVLAVALWPLYRRFCRLLPERGRTVLVPLLFTLLAGLVLIVPLGIAAVEIGCEGQAAVGWLAEAQQNGVPVPGWLARLPLIGARAAAWWQAHLGDPEAVEALVGRVDMGRLAAWTREFGAQLAHRAVLVLVMPLALFFLFRDGEWLGGRLLAHADRWLGDPGEHLAEKLISAVRGTVVGTVVVAVGEGVLIGVGYAVAGVPHPVLFGAITAAVAMLPFGAWLAFTAAALVLLGQGSPLAAIGLFGFGAAVMLVGDNVVQPALVGGVARLPLLWALVGIFGGLETFGLLGLFLGPVIMAALLTVWREWIDAPTRVKRR
jgi:predicted PurR-regulated permease PerM